MSHWWDTITAEAKGESITATPSPLNWQESPEEQKVQRLAALLHAWLPEHGQTLADFEDAMTASNSAYREDRYRQQPWYKRVWWALHGCTDADAMSNR